MNLDDYSLIDSFEAFYHIGRYEVKENGEKKIEAIAGYIEDKGEPVRVVFEEDYIETWDLTEFCEDTEDFIEIGAEGTMGSEEEAFALYNKLLPILKEENGKKWGIFRSNLEF